MPYTLVPADGATPAYYWDPDTNDVSWTRPDTGSAMTGVSSALPDTCGASNTVNHWTLVIDPASGAPYYFHAETNEVRWEKPDDFVASETLTALVPTTAAPAPATAPAAADTTAALPAALAQRLAQRGITNHLQPSPAPVQVGPPALPPGWKPLSDPSGNIFFRNVFSGEMAWTHPGLTNRLTPQPPAAPQQPAAQQPPAAQPASTGALLPPWPAPAPLAAAVQMLQKPPHSTSSNPPPCGMHAPTTARLSNAPPSAAVLRRLPPPDHSILGPGYNPSVVGPGYRKAVTVHDVPTNRPTPYDRRTGKGHGKGHGKGGRGGRGAPNTAPIRGGSAYDPLDPSSWEGYDVPIGGWSRGLATSSGSAPPAPSGEAGAAPAGAAVGPLARPAVGKALPSPGEILRMNAAMAGGGGAGGAPAR